GLVLGFAALALVVGKQGLRFLAQTAGLVQLLAARFGARAEWPADDGGYAVVEDRGDEPAARDHQPGFWAVRIEQHGYDLPSALTAAFASSALTSWPSRRATTARAVSVAISPTLCSALSFVAAMRVSASVSLALIWPSTRDR